MLMFMLALSSRLRVCATFVHIFCIRQDTGSCKILTVKKCPGKCRPTVSGVLRISQGGLQPTPPPSLLPPFPASPPTHLPSLARSQDCQNEEADRSSALPSLPLSSLHLLSPPIPFLPLRSRPLLNPARGSGGAL